MLEASCHCGAVRVRFPAAPETVTSCNCSVCRRYGTLWAYFTARDVEVIAPEGVTDAYSWGEDPALFFRRCAHCGNVMTWERLVPNPEWRMGVNMRMADPAVLAAARVRRLDGADTWEWLD
jgi:hypothetical protein